MLSSVRPPSGINSSPKCSYGAVRLFKYFAPPEGSAGKNFITRQSSSRAVSRSEGVAIPGAKGSPIAWACSITRRFRAGCHAERSSRCYDVAHLPRRENGSDPHKDFWCLLSKDRDSLDCSIGPQRQLDHVYAPGNQCLGYGHRVSNVVNNQHGNHATLRYSIAECFRKRGGVRDTTVPPQGCQPLSD